MSAVSTRNDESEMTMTSVQPAVRFLRHGGRTRRPRLVLASALAILLAGAASAAAAPTWDIDSAANTTVPAGGQITYYVAVRNVGDAPTDGSQFDVAIDLPPEMTAVSATGLAGAVFDCSSIDVGTSNPFTCVSSEVLDIKGDQGFAVVADVSPLAAGAPTATFAISGGGVGAPASTVDATRIAQTPPGFGIDVFDGQITANAAGDPVTRAGSHPYALSQQILLNTVTDPDEGDVWPVAPMKDLVVDLPPGFVGDPTSMGRCTAEQLLGESGVPLCPSSSQVGIVRFRFNSSSAVDFRPVFNMVPPPTSPARFGFSIAGTLLTLDATVRTGGDYGLSVLVHNAPEALALTKTEVTFWGNPSDASHDFQRSCPGSNVPGCSTESTVPFLRMPTSCTAPGVGLVTALRADSWYEPGVFKTASFTTHLAPNFPFAPSDWGAPVGLGGCDQVPFDGKLSGTAESPALANQPAGFSFDLSIPQNGGDEIGQSDLRKAVVTLPPGVRVSPSSADGLKACSPAQIGLSNADDPSCPDGAKLGTLTIETPLLDDPLKGAIYLATPFDNPSNTLIGIYLVARGPGLVIKLAGRADTDPNTGQITATFDDNPQVPFSNLHLEFFGGPRAALVLPPKCGTYTTHAVLTSWSGKTRVSDSSFILDKNGKGQPCPATQPFSPTFEAGTLNPVAGEHSSFVMTLKRSDQDQEIHSLSLDMPQGILARIKGVPQCAAAQAAAGTCGEDSRVGTVTTGAGAGTNPFFLDGQVYFSGPYKGAPFSLSIVVPAVAGPFDLGKVVVRTAIDIDRKTARLRISSDPFPSILQGIPLQVREVRVKIDRERFMLNPTSCREKTIGGTVTSTEGVSADVSSRFQVGECARLSLRPRMTLRVGAKGRTRSGGSTPLVTTLRQPSGQSGLKSVAVKLPLLFNARLPVVNKACTPAQFDAGDCEKARAGSAVAVTPLLAKPLKGGVYFVRNRPKGLPDLVVALRGEVDFDLTGKVKIPRDNSLSTVFDTIPDVPVTSFTLRLVAGRNGPLGTTANLCTRKAHRATARLTFVGQNGKRLTRSQRLKIAGCGGKGKKGLR